MPGLLYTIAKQFENYSLHLMRVGNVTWNKFGILNFRELPGVVLWKMA
jgi:hypothetical protein